MIRVLLIFLALATAVAADPPLPPPQPLAFHDLVKHLAQRYDGRILAARVDAPTPFEFAAGTDQVQEITLLSPQHNIILIRMDARSGRILDVRGRGLAQARRHGPDRREERND